MEHPALTHIDLSGLRIDQSEWARLQQRLAGAKLRLDAPPTSGAMGLRTDGPQPPRPPPPTRSDGGAPVSEPASEPAAAEAIAESWVQQLPYLDLYVT